MTQAEREILASAPPQVVQLVRAEVEPFERALRSVMFASGSDIAKAEERWADFTHPAVVRRTIGSLASMQNGVQNLITEANAGKRDADRRKFASWEHQLGVVKRFTKRAKDSSGIDFTQGSSVRRTLQSIGGYLERGEAVTLDFHNALTAFRDALYADLDDGEEPADYELALLSHLDKFYEGGIKPMTLAQLASDIERGIRR